MKRFCIHIVSLLLLVCPWMLTLPATAYAAGASVAILVTPQSLQEGDIFTVNLTFSAGSAIGSFQAGLTYDQSRMEYITGGGNAVELSGGTGGIVDNGSSGAKALSYSLRFRAVKAGEASFAVTDTEINDYDTGENLGNLHKSVTIPIAAKTTATPATPTPTPSLKEPIPVSIDGETLYVMREFWDASLPDGYDLVTISYHGENVQAAVHPSGLTLLSVLDAAGNEEFYIYSAGPDVLYPCVTITAGGGDYTIFPMDDWQATGYTPATITIGNQPVHALSSEINAGFYLLYAMNSQGDSGYYFFDATEGTMQRASVQTIGQPAADAASTPQPEASLNVWLLLLIPAGVCILLLILIVLQFRKYRMEGHK